MRRIGRAIEDKGEADARGGRRDAEAVVGYALRNMIHVLRVNE